jgi:hypothetical protein
MTSPRQPDDRDLPAAYVASDPDAVRAAAPKEPTEAEWAVARRRIQARLNQPKPSTNWPLRVGLLAGAAALVFAAAAVAWVAFDRAIPPRNPQVPQVPEVAEAKPAPKPVAPLPHEASSDPLAEFAVLPMANEEDVVLTRVPGDGWLPVGTHPLLGAISLATADEVELDDPEAAWPNVMPAPGYAPMIFAAKPR